MLAVSAGEGERRSPRAVDSTGLGKGSSESGLPKMTDSVVQGVVSRSGRSLFVSSSSSSGPVAEGPVEPMDQRSGPVAEGPVEPMDEDIELRPEEEEGESAQSKSLRVPGTPMEAMIREHEVTHIPFRSWCVACVRGRARGAQHRKQDRTDQELGEHQLNMDYSFFGTEELHAASFPTVVIQHRQSRSVWAHMVSQKGLDEYAVGCVLSALRKIGCKRAFIKVDQENPITALVKEVRARWEGELLQGKQNEQFKVSKAWCEPWFHHSKSDQAFVQNQAWRSSVG